MKRAGIIGLLAIFIIGATISTSVATSAHYTFTTVPATGWVSSSDKTLPSSTAFNTRVDTVTGSPQAEANKGIYYRGINKNTTNIIGNLEAKVGPSQRTIIAPTSSSRLVYIKLQTLGKTTGNSSAAGYWYY